MQPLTPEQTQLALTESVMLYLIIGVVFFAISVLIMTFLFGWSMKLASKDIGKLAVFLFVSLTIPVTIGYTTSNSSVFTRPEAEEMIQIFNIEITPLTINSLSNNSVIVSFNTSSPVSAYLEYTDSLNDLVMPILPTYSLEHRAEHSFIIDPISNQGGIAHIIINGKRYSVNDHPIEILNDYGK